MCAPRRAAAVVRPRGREKSADRRRRILISRLLIIRASVPRWKSPFPAYFKGFPAVSPLIPPYPAFLKYPVSPHPLEDCQIAGESHEEELEDHSEAARIQKLLHALREPYKEVFMWRVYGEKSFRDIGALFGKTENWACVTYHRAKRMIREGLEDD